MRWTSSPCHEPTLAHVSVDLAVVQYQWQEGITSEQRIWPNVPEDSAPGEYRGFKTGRGRPRREEDYGPS